MRRLFTILSALSLLLFVAVLVLWVRSYHFTLYGAGFVGRITFSAGLTTATWWKAGVWSSHGSVAMGVENVTYEDEGGIRWVREEQRERAEFLGFEEVNYPFPQDWPWWEPASGPTFRTEFAMGRTKGIGRYSYVTGVAAPYWLVASLSLVLPSIHAAGALRRRRLADRGRCPSCGYDLRATPDRCPECGTQPQVGSESV